jgi:hypothetical protein
MIGKAAFLFPLGSMEPEILRPPSTMYLMFSVELDVAM